MSGPEKGVTWKHKECFPCSPFWQDLGQEEMLGVSSLLARGKGETGLANSFKSRLLGFHP